MPRISDLSSLTAPSNDDELAIVDKAGAITKKIKRSDLLKGTPLPADSIDTNAVQYGAVTPDKRSGGFFSVSHTFSAGTGSKSVTGFGFKPKMVTFTLSPSPSSTVAFWGYGVAYDTGSTPSGNGIAIAADGSTGRSSRGSHFLAVNTTATTYQGDVTSFDADGITVNIVTDASSAYRTWLITAWG